MTRFLGLEGFRVSFKRIQRFWRTLTVSIVKIETAARSGEIEERLLSVSTSACQSCLVPGFIFDRAPNGQPPKWHPIVACQTRRCTTVHVSLTVNGKDMINRVAELFLMCGVPEAIHRDNGLSSSPLCHPEMIGPCGCGHTVLRAGQYLVERIRRKLSSSIARRVIEYGRV